MGTERITELQKLGFKNTHLQAWLSEDPNQAPARVSSVERGLCTVLVPNPEVADNDTISSSSILSSVRVLPHPKEKVAVGDWILTDLEHEHPRVLSVLPRASLLARGALGEQSGAQPIAANVDAVLVVVAASTTTKLTRRGLRPSRIERYVLAARQAGALPVVIVNKCDLATESEIDDALGGRFRDVDVIRTSSLATEPFSEVAEVLLPGTTAVLVGPSGVGKSTITNALLGETVASTKEVRSGDSKGRHTTTSRSMHRLSNGAFLIDTPGMREFGMISADGILEVAADCRFSDCAHAGEPGCAVREAIENGELSADWVEDQLSLKNEALRHEARRDAYSRHLIHKKHKQFAGVVREALAKKHSRRK